MHTICPARATCGVRLHLGRRTMLVSQIATENEGTVRNLQKAFENESNGRTKYMAYAAEADSGGFHGVASLLRATSRSEQITANNHARVLQQLGLSLIHI